jgi:hypothetical protein
VIGPGGTFFYEVVLGAGLRGRADAQPTRLGHPGTVGDRPMVQVVDDTVVLQRAESVFGRRNPHYEKWGQPASRLTMKVGPLLSALAAPGDRVTVARHGTGDLSAELRRDGQTLLGLGGISREHHPALVLEPPSDEDSDEVLGAAASLDRPGARFVWLDAADPAFEQHIAEVRTLDCSLLNVSIAGPDVASRQRASRLFAGGAVQARGPATAICLVPTRFTTEASWLTHLRALRAGPRNPRPVRFRLADEVIALRAGESAARAPWLLHVARTDEGGAPGSMHNVGIALERDGVTLALLIESSETVSARRTFSER